MDLFLNYPEEVLILVEICCSTYISFISFVFNQCGMLGIKLYPLNCPTSSSSLGLEYLCLGTNHTHPRMFVDDPALIPFVTTDQ